MILLLPSSCLIVTQMTFTNLLININISINTNPTADATNIKMSSSLARLTRLLQTAMVNKLKTISHMQLSTHSLK